MRIPSNPTPTPTIIKPYQKPLTEWVRRRGDNKLVKWVQKPISTLTNEPVTQVNPISKTKEYWLHDHYTWVIEKVKEED